MKYVNKSLYSLFVILALSSLQAFGDCVQKNIPCGNNPAGCMTACCKHDATACKHPSPAGFLCCK